ncbi:hypothetical protein ACJRO7_017137 [Eucalyptus globulus]|uniref:FCP1 homology domain-containing protein n=1 Tax=Eucalyptus globulus TaxID=34317 RepID=A0ABD3KWC3_EUCGL
MVSRIIRRTPTKSIKDCRGRRGRSRRLGKKSPVKNAAAAPGSFIATINKSLHSCQRRLIKIFSKLAHIGTPSRRKGFRVLQKVADEPPPSLAGASLCRSLSFDAENHRLPPLVSPTKKTVFLDLDETLVHSQTDPPPEKFDFVVQPTINGERLNFYVLKRPGVDDFLRVMSAKFELVIFTAGVKEYASLVLDRLDQKRSLISHRLYRDSCEEVDGKFVKDLSKMGRDLQRVVIVDDNPNAYVFQPENAIPVCPFVNDLDDVELGKLAKFFEGTDGFDDMREAVKQYRAEEDFKLEVMGLMT